MVILSKSVKSRPRLKIAVYLDESVLDKGSELIITIEPTAPVKSLYMRIMDETGVMVWRTALIAQGYIPYYQLVLGTGGLIGNKSYTIEVSTNTKFRPIGMATFELKALGELPPLIPILLPIVAPSLLRRYHPRGPDDQPEVEHRAQPPELTKHQDEIEPVEINRKWREWINRVEREQERGRGGGILEPTFYYLYVSVDDGRVCQMCLKETGKFFAPYDHRPYTPQHDNCRCYYEIIQRGEILSASTYRESMMVAAIVARRMSK